MRSRQSIQLRVLPGLFSTGVLLHFIRTNAVFVLFVVALHVGQAEMKPCVEHKVVNFDGRNVDCSSLMVILHSYGHPNSCQTMFCDTCAYAHTCDTTCGFCDSEPPSDDEFFDTRCNLNGTFTAYIFDEDVLGQRTQNVLHHFNIPFSSTELALLLYPKATAPFGFIFFAVR